MYAGRVACYPLVIHVEYALRAILTLEKRWDSRTDGRMDGRQTDALRLQLDVVIVTSRCRSLYIKPSVQM